MGRLVNCIAREGNIGYVGSGERLVVLDVTDPTNIIELSSIRLGSTLFDVAVRDEFAYVVADGIEGTRGEHSGGRCAHVVDVRDAKEPKLVWGSPDDDWPYKLNELREVDLYCNANGSLAIVRNDNPEMVAIHYVRFRLESSITGVPVDRGEGSGLVPRATTDGSLASCWSATSLWMGPGQAQPHAARHPAFSPCRMRGGDICSFFGRCFDEHR